MHEHHVHREPVQPSREGAFTAEGADLAEQLQEGLLGQILSLGGVAGHAQAQRVNAAFVQVVEELEGLGFALLGAPDSLSLGPRFGRNGVMVQNVVPPRCSIQVLAWTRGRWLGLPPTKGAGASKRPVSPKMLFWSGNPHPCAEHRRHFYDESRNHWPAPGGQNLPV